MEILGVSTLTLMVTEVLKRAFSIKKNLVPMVSLIVGSLIVLVMWFTQKDAVFTWDTITKTFLAIAAANGVYSGVKTTMGK